MTRKSWFTVSAVACVLVLMLAGCASGSSGSASPAASGSASSSSASSASSSSEQSSEPNVGIADPWHDVSSMRDAAAGAGINGFVIPEGERISLGVIAPEIYRYMDGLAEARVLFPEIEVTIRKGLTQNNGDLSGDYNQYAYTWVQNVNGVDVTCSGSHEGEAAKAIWSNGEYSYSITVRVIDNIDADCGLAADDLAVLVAGTM